MLRLSSTVMPPLYVEWAISQSSQTHLHMLYDTTALLIAAVQWVVSCPAIDEDEQLHQGQLTFRIETVLMHWFSSTWTIRALPDDAIDTLLVLVDCPEPVSCITYSGVSQKLMLCHELDCILSGDSGQGEAPRSSFLDKILALLRNGIRVYQVGWRMIGRHIEEGDEGMLG